MPAILVLNVPEFLPLVEASRGKAGLEVVQLCEDYFRISARGELRFSRKELGLKPALWYGSLTAGLHGTIARFDRDELCIVDAPS